MVQIFNEIGTERTPELDNLIANLPGQVQSFQDNQKQNQSLGDLAEQLGVFDLTGEGGTGIGIDRDTFSNLPAEAKNAVLKPAFEQIQQKRSAETVARRVTAYEKAAGVAAGTFTGLDDAGAQKLAVEFVKHNAAGQKLPDQVKSYLAGAQKNLSEAEELIPIIERLDVLIDSGGADANQIANGIGSLPGFGWMKNPDSVEFDSGASLLIEKFKKAIGGRITQVEFEEFKKKLPGVGKSRAANKQLLELLTSGSKIAQRRQQLINDIRRENGGFAPADIDITVEDQLRDEQEQFRRDMNSFGEEQEKKAPIEQRAGFVAMRDPKTGQERYILEANVAAAQEAKWQVVQ